MKYEQEEKLKLTERVWLTKEAYKTLRKLKAIKKISMAKIVCNLIFQAYEEYKTNKAVQGKDEEIPDTIGREGVGDAKR